MLPKLIGDPDGTAWRSGDLAPGDSRPVRADLIAGIAVVAALAQALFVPVTLLLVIAFVVVGRLSQWRPIWLVMPAIGGLAWTLSIGVRPTLAGYLAGAGHLVAHLPRIWAPVAKLALPRGLLAGWRTRLPGQVPAALLIAAGETALIGSLGRRRAVRRGSGGSASRSYRPGARVSVNRSMWNYPYRSGAVIAARRRYLTWSTGRGELATADGGCVGIDWRTGRRASISWREAGGGVLCTGPDAASVTATGLTLTLAAIAHRKAVIVIDLAVGGDASCKAVAEAIEAACANVGAPLRRFGGPGGYYDPLSAARVRGAGQHGGGLRGVVPPGQHGLAAYPTAGLRGRLGIEPTEVAPVAAELEALRAGPAGRWLCQPAGGQGISLRRALADREVVVFGFGRSVVGRSAAMIARLAVADLAANVAGYGERGALADCLIWVNGCEAIARRQLTTLVGLGASCGAAVVLSTAADPAAAALADGVKVVAIRGQAPHSRWAQVAPSLGSRRPTPGWAPDLNPPDLAPAGQAGLAERASLDMQDDAPLPARLLNRRPDDALSVLVRGPRPRLLTGCLAVR